MKTFILSLLLLTCNILCNANKLTGIYSQKEDSQKMYWHSPEIEKYKNAFNTYYDDDVKKYANNIKDNINLYKLKENPKNQDIIMQCHINVSNPNYDKHNLFNYLRQWIVNKHKDWKDKIKIDEEKKVMYTTNLVTFHDIAKYSNFTDEYRVSIETFIELNLVNDSSIVLTILVPNYILDLCNADTGMGLRNQKRDSKKYLIPETFPYNPKSSNKKSFSIGLVNTYLTLYKFTEECINDLNIKFTEDKEYLVRKKYEADDKLLYSKYGEPTNILKFEENNINKEIRVYENAQKIIILGKEMNFKDIIGCTLEDNPTIIKGNTTTTGGSVGIFFFAVGESRTYRSPDKTIHSYVVNIESDNLASPLIRISTGNDADRAKNIESIMRIIIKRNQSASPTQSSTNKKRTR